MASRPRTGTSAEHTYVVTETDTARSLGSGSLDVLGTPRLLAWLEATTCDALAPDLDPGDTSLGSRVRLEHLVPSPLGAQVAVRAEVTHSDGRLVRLQAMASHADGVVVGHAEITRVVVDRNRFLARLSDPDPR